MHRGCQIGWPTTATSGKSETVAADDGQVIEPTLGFFTSNGLFEARVVKNFCQGFSNVNYNKDDELARLLTLTFGFLSRAATLLSWCQGFSNVDHKNDDELTRI